MQNGQIERLKGQLGETQCEVQQLRGRLADAEKERKEARKERDKAIKERDKAEKQEGIICVVIPEGRYEGTLKDGKPHGEGRLLGKKDRVIYEGGWKEGKRHGRGMSYHPNGIREYVGQWKEGKKHGRARGTSYKSSNGTVLAHGVFGKGLL